MKAINVYLNFNGTTEEAFNFYKSVFGGEFTTFQKFKDTPGADKFPPEVQEKIMHVALPVGPAITLMGSDGPNDQGKSTVFGNNIHLSIEAESKEEAEKMFKGLSAGGNVTMPLADTFWNAYFGMFIDKFGISWLINYQKTEGVK